LTITERLVEGMAEKKVMKTKEPASRVEKVKLLTDLWKAFPNLTTLGSYEHFSQTIHLASVTPEEFRAAFGARDFAARRKVVPLLYHELTHWVDHVTTLWGMEYLVAQFNAINARRNETETELWRAVELMKMTKRHHYADYYTLVYEKGFEPHDGHPWRWQLSTGLTFDVNGKPDPSTPIAFTKFQNAAGEDVCRVPFSVASLLEVNAMYEELTAVSGLLGELNGDDRIVETGLLSQETLKRLYDPLLAVYTVAAHFFANRARVKDTLTAYANASRVSGFCLNFPRRLFPQLVVPETFAAWGERNEHFKARCDRGYLFMLLLQHAGDTDFKDLDEWFTTVLERAGLPSMDEIRAVADEELKNIFLSEIPGRASDRLSQLQSVGRKHQLKYGLRLNATYRGIDELIPPILLSDNTIITGKNALNVGTFAEPDKWIDDAWRHSNAIREFVEACLP
jgi:hypothetical protein